ncbi:hypothetical protein ACK31Z_11345 [Aeromonas dhakensis]|uniref:hypothetical protein n=1 Tax=Aeromonas TaxID=642 RepID=UPI00038F3566|nr:MULTISPECIES: hypothetical protein [Aeromonas]EJN6955913.1 hypothetical protein [Aeromonas hydrophila]MDX7837545.1 hypothetical protein [Aeromonas caviae]CAD7560218.1 hypothetical protein KBAH04_43390 [Aeromonas hydrophila]HDZ8876708.1 hypothetical protein [Aeromonas dhakensis]
MKKSDVKYDLKKIVERVDAMKNAPCLSDKQQQLNDIVELLMGISNELSLGMAPSITGRPNPELRCRFCGK